MTVSIDDKLFSSLQNHNKNISRYQVIVMSEIVMDRRQYKILPYLGTV